MQLGDLLLNMSSFLGTLWVWFLRLFTTTFSIGGVEVTLWSVFIGVGVVAYLTVFIIRVFV